MLDTLFYFPIYCSVINLCVFQKAEERFDGKQQRSSNHRYGPFIATERRRGNIYLFILFSM